MRKVREAAKPVSFFLAIFMMVVFSPYQTVLAKMVTAETVLDAGRVNAARAYVNTVLAREDVTTALVSQEIDVREAMARINTLSDAEIIALADQMESLPAGGSSFGIIVGASIVIFIVLLVTDIMGYTDIFPFVKKKQI
ncbi:MAG: PA2779 family protein [Desulfosarcina sp.]|nr:PA2779 family protein [Desulfosarcina sp.]MBC2744415.1 PA2779 family protein [Desulfosarcina sp.]MBC2767323.1 PA2779 family protein [Desulfosarcina sp.]